MRMLSMEGSRGLRNTGPVGSVELLVTAEEAACRVVMQGQEAERLRRSEGGGKPPCEVKIGKYAFVVLKEGTVDMYVGLAK